MKKEPSWDFVSTQGGREDGIHNPMIEQFGGNYNYSLAREIIQNSLDAKQDKSKLPVTVAFKLEQLSKHDFPEQKQMLATLSEATQTGRTMRKEH